jgi:hypothetical protein
MMRCRGQIDHTAPVSERRFPTLILEERTETEVAAKAGAARTHDAV